MIEIMYPHLPSPQSNPIRISTGPGVYPGIYPQLPPPYSINDPTLSGHTVLGICIILCTPFQALLVIILIDACRNGRLLFHWLPTIKIRRTAFCILVIITLTAFIVTCLTLRIVKLTI